ncbi:MAG: PSD1 and planctomycete cytochrome C domain-containing protein [Lentisphaeraceae bacterium]|nr:PSD1 and planctomycete cytochrome C domain-containing protein [Lentisphaeraceae bacterium]
MKLCVYFMVLFVTAVSSYSAPPLNFERDILPIFKNSCFKCHSDETKKPKAGLRMDLKEKMLTHEDFLTPGKAKQSSLYTLIALSKGHDDIMPPENKAPEVSAKDIEKVKNWINQGAHFNNWEKYVSNKVIKLESGLSKAKVKTDLKSASAMIDSLVKKNLISKKLKANPKADDETYLRRTYISIIGRIPSLEEARSFLDSNDPNKKIKLIKQLQNSPGYVSNNFNYWANILRVKSNQKGNLNEVWTEYLKSSIEENKPYDKWVHEMVTAEGRLWENPAIGFMYRDAKNRVAGYESLTSVFLGTEIACAQCHDHPYDTITRRDYFEMYGYYNSSNMYFPSKKRLKYLDGQKMHQRGMKVHDNMRKKIYDYGTLQASKEVYLTAFISMQRIGDKVTSRPDSRFSKFPHDYQYDDGQPKKHLEPNVLFGKIRKTKEGEKPIRVFADWLIDPDNLKFTYVASNRLWHRIMGESLLGRLTHISQIENSMNPELSRYLAELFVSLKYDQKAFERVIFNSQIYQRMASIEGQTKKQKAFTGPVLRRLTAEQLWDSLMTLIDPNLDKNIVREKPDLSYLTGLVNAKTEDEYWSMIEKGAKELRPAHTNYLKNKRAREVFSGKIDSKYFKRASELRQPTPIGHFMRLFGQADRETVEDQWINPTVPQSLTLLNGPLFDYITAPNSKFMKQLKQSKLTEDKVRSIFTATLSKRPSQDQLDESISLLNQSSGSEDYKSLIWGLLNTRQFLFIP